MRRAGLRMAAGRADVATAFGFCETAFATGAGFRTGNAWTSAAVLNSETR